MKHYFYSDGEKQKGPFTFEQLKNENIEKETLIWFEGLEDWKPAKEINEIELILELIPPPIVPNFENNEKESTDKIITFYDTKPHPWRRFLARTLDVYTGGIVVFFIFGFAIGDIAPQFVDDYVKLLENPIMAVMDAVLIYLCWIPLEALFISLFGTTPIKWIFGISVLSRTGENLTYLNAIKRSFNVFVQGEGLAIPLITFFTRLYAYKRLNKTGTTLWDTSVNSIVTHKEWGVTRTIATIFVTIVAIIILAY
jgi:uncharacterized RDD family membrane protein YckC